MGKSKNKKSKQTSEIAQLPKPGETEPDSSGPAQAIDGHNTQGWTDNEIKAYNELIIERQKLEKQRHELEEKCAKSQTQRALLHENVANIDSMFKQQKSMSAAFKFTGSSKCCVDVEGQQNCHHEICKRAKSDGVSDVELDAIKYYSLRIHTEKSERIRNALRKQRDLELVRIKKEEEDGQLQTARRTSKISKSGYGDISKLAARGSRSKEMSRAAKETEKVVNKIIHQLDDLRSDLQTGRISAEEAQGKLNLLDSKLPAMQDKATKSALEGSIASMTSHDIKSTTESFQSHLRERLLNAKGDTFSQAFSIMDHFLSATKPDDLQEAISELKDVLQLTGPMCDELQNSLGALEGIFDNPDKLSFTGPDGKQECSSIIDLMEKLKETLKRTGQLPDGANASLTKVFQECIDLEAEAKEHLTHKCSDDSTTSANLPAVLVTIKEEFVAKSPIPPLTSNKLDSDIANLLDVYDARQLLSKVQSGVKANELEAQITTLVITRTQRKSGKYIEKLERLEIACRSAGKQDGSDILKESINNVLTKMKKWVQPSDIEKSKQVISNGKPDGRSSSGSKSNETSENIMMSGTIGHSARNSPTPPLSMRAPSPEQLAKQVQKAIRDSIAQNGNIGLWDTFDVFAQKTSFQVDIAMLEKAESYKEKTRSMIEDPAYGVKSTICYLYKLKLCPGLTASLISQALLDISESSESDCRTYVKQLSSCIDGLPRIASPEWSSIFQYLALAMVQCYVAVYIESMATFPNVSPTYFSLSAMDMLTKCVLLTRSSDVSLENLRVVTGYLLICFSAESLQHAPNVQDFTKHYRNFCVANEFKCLTTSSCSKHMHFARMPHNPSVSIGRSARQVRELYHSSLSNRASKIHNIQRIGHAFGSTSIMDPDHNLQSAKIKPRKTIITYPPGHKEKQDEEAVSRKRDARLAEDLKIAAALSESTAKKAFALLKLRSEDYIAKRVLPPTELTDAMQHITATTRNKFHLPPRGQVTSESDMTPKNSRFSEHLDESRQSSRHMLGTSALNIHDVLKQLINGKIDTRDVDSIVVFLKNECMSGKWSDPVEQAAHYIGEVLAKDETNENLRQRLLEMQSDIQHQMEDPKTHLVHETRRLVHFLRTVNVSEPSLPKLYLLASKERLDFQQYCKLIWNRLKETETERAKILHSSWADVDRLAEHALLKIDSPPLIDLFACVMDDWSRRPRQLTKYRSDADVRLYLSDADEISSEVVTQELDNFDDDLPTIAKSPAKYPVVERRPSEASLVASQASVSSPELSTQPIKPQLSEQISREAKHNRQQHQPSVPDTRPHHDKDASVQSPRTALEAKEVESTTTKDEVSRVSEAQYLLPEGEPTSGPDGSDVKTGSVSPPASFRMLDMTKHLVKLQKNRDDLFESEKEITKLDEDLGIIVQGVAEKVAGIVTRYTDFVECIASWNGIELAREGFQVN